MICSREPELMILAFKKMGKRYYCDFCDRSFADTGVNRKNHFKGTIHQRFRKQHYDSFKDAASLLVDDELKLPCHRFQMGTCDYGDNCKFSHMTAERKKQLQDQAARDKARTEEKARLDAMEPTLEEWLSKRRKRQKVEKEGDKETVEDIQYTLPPFLASIPSLPPSLMPPTAEELRNKQLFEWG